MMEFHFIPFPLNFLNLFLLFGFLILLVKKWQTTNTPKIRLPPGPLKLPFIGNMHNLVGGLPHVVLRELARKYGPLIHLDLGEVPTVVVSSPEMAKEVLVNHDPAFADRPVCLATKIMSYDQQDLIFTPYSDHWRQMRRICMTELLSAKNVGSFSFIRKDEITKLMESIQSSLGYPISATELFFKYACSMTCRAAYGGICRDNETMIAYLKEAAILASGFNVADAFPSLKMLPIISGLKGKLIKMHHKFDSILDDVINQHKVNHEKGKMGNAESGDQDLVDVLLRQQENSNLQIPITSEKIKAVLFDMFTSGTDTSSITTEWAMSELMKHPSVMTKVQAEVRQVCNGKKTIEEADIQKLIYLKMVVKETLRLHPAIPLIPRASNENHEVKGYVIPDKFQVMVNAWALGRDPEHWDDPDSFKPERFEKKSVDYVGTHLEYIPFGTGRRVCPGIAFGLANVELPLANLLFHFDWRLPNGMKPGDLDINEGRGASVGRKNELYLVATAYNHSRND